MKRNVVSPSTCPGLRFRLKLSNLFSCGAVAASLWASSAHATSYYWDTNGVAAGAGPTPTGTWDGTNTFFNTDSTGGNGTTSGTFVGTLGATDTVQFVAGPTLTATGDTVVSGGNPYVVTVSGTQTAGGLVFNSAGSLTLGATVGGGTIALGGMGMTGLRYTNGTTTQGTSAVIAAVVINSNLQLTADQTWTTGQVSSTATPALTIAGAVSGTANLTIANTTSRAFLVSGAMTQTGNVTFGGGNTTGSVSGNIGVAGNVIVGFSATGSNVNFSRAAGNSYTGTTSITGGILNINNTSGSATSTGNVTLSAATGLGSTIGGTGISTGLLTVTSNGVISPAAATTAGTITLGSTGGLTLTSATLNLNLAATTAAASDKIVTGALTLGSALTVNLSEVGSTATALSTTGTYTLITDTNGAALNLSNTTITTNFAGFTTTYTPTYSSDSAGDLLVSFAQVPEPSTWAGVLLALVAGAWSQRKRLVARRAPIAC